MSLDAKVKEETRGVYVCHTMALPFTLKSIIRQFYFIFLMKNKIIFHHAKI
jgi:hypothetical protein